MHIKNRQQWQKGREKMKIYRYTGSIGELGWTNGARRNMLDIKLYDPNNDDVPPTRLTALGEIAEYIDSLEGTDDDERYLRTHYYYDDNLTLVGVEIPAVDKGPIPAKMIVCGLLTAADHGMRVYGPRDYITSDAPDPMSDSEYDRLVNDLMQMVDGCPEFYRAVRRTQRERQEACEARAMRKAHEARETEGGEDDD